MEKVKKLMTLLDCTEEEAKDIIKTDSEIDKGKKHFELTPEQKKAEKKMRVVGIKTVNPYGKQTTREKKADVDKGKLISDLLDGIPYVENIEIINLEREFTFTFRDKKYKVVLSCPRN